MLDYEILLKSNGDLATDLFEVQSGIKPIMAQIFDDPLALALKKGNEELKNKLNEIIIKINESGQLDVILAKYV